MSLINRSTPPATADAVLVERLEAEGAILVGALNMGEYAYDFTGENLHDGPSRNPHDPEHMTGGSSGGSGGAVASGMVPLALGSDTNGSIRVPSALCGLFGLKPTFGRLPRTGSFPFVSSLDHLGPMARTTVDLALAYDAMQGHDPADPACADREAEPVVPLIGAGISGLRIAKAGGYFTEMAQPEALEAVDRVAQALGAAREIELPEARRARSAAYVITTAEGASLHIERLRRQASDFDPAVRDRLLAGAMVPAAWLIKAQKFRRVFREAVLRLFDEVDAILAPATPCRAPRIGQTEMLLAGNQLPVRANLGLFTSRSPSSGFPSPRCRSGRKARGCRSVSRSSRRPGARISCCASRRPSRCKASARRRWPKGGRDGKRCQ
ncbi:aspartyl-tRNA(Asn)/glutamyl-tRNA(Gln) amidotransferase subunit A [Rhizobiales bacterium GAS113]|nr:aspartyl-tRNA(Asn)/glutamyl-tRNA(Gln) amidotransferase subunit A [Rhizobiales bacterium GAS113]